MLPLSDAHDAPTGTALAAGSDRWRQGRSLVFLVLLSVSVLQAGPHTPALIALVLVAGAAWAATALRLVRTAARPWVIAVCAASGLGVTAVDTGGFAPCYLLAATTLAVAVLPLRLAVTGSLAGAVALAGVLAWRGSNWTSLVVWVSAVNLVLVLAVLRRQRDEQTERASVLQERARLAREIHDVLAHSLSALSVQLETAAALLERDRPADAAVLVDRAGRLARDGLTETRRAVSALRGDPLPLAELLEDLAGGYRADAGAPATVTVDGTPRALDADTGLVLFRVTQEALTNVRRHAKGATVAVHLGFERHHVHLTVGNGPAAGGHGAPGRRGGYGLVGMRERAELAGGTCSAGPHGDGWRVDVKMPG